MASIDAMKSRIKSSGHIEWSEDEENGIIRIIDPYVECGVSSRSWYYTNCDGNKKMLVLLDEHCIQYEYAGSRWGGRIGIQECKFNFNFPAPAGIELVSYESSNPLLGWSDYGIELVSGPNRSMFNDYIRNNLTSKNLEGFFHETLTHLVGLGVGKVLRGGPAPDMTEMIFELQKTFEELRRKKTSIGKVLDKIREIEWGLVR